MDFVILSNEYNVVQVGVKDISSLPIPSSSDFYSLTITKEEVSVITSSEISIPDARVEGPWKVFKIEGVLDFALTGILSAVAAVLADAKISIFALSTYNTDFILVKTTQESAAKAVLEAAGHKFK